MSLSVVCVSEPIAAILSTLLDKGDTEVAASAELVTATTSGA
jgi:hypothetical protein